MIQRTLKVRNYTTCFLNSTKLCITIWGDLVVIKAAETSNLIESMLYLITEEIMLINVFITRLYSSVYSEHWLGPFSHAQVTCLMQGAWWDHELSNHNFKSPSCYNFTAYITRDKQPKICLQFTKWKVDNFRNLFIIWFQQFHDLFVTNTSPVLPGAYHSKLHVLIPFKL